MTCKCGYKTLENTTVCLKCRSQREELLKKWIERSNTISQRLTPCNEILQ